jgi:hypothetical protein
MLQFFCMQQNYSWTLFSQVKFSALSFKTEIEMLAPSSPMDIKLERFLQKSGFTNTHIHIWKSTCWIFFKFCKKTTSIYGQYNLPFLGKLNLASFQNGGFAQNGHKNLVFLPKLSQYKKNYVLSFNFSL